MEIKFVVMYEPLHMPAFICDTVEEAEDYIKDYVSEWDNPDNYKICFAKYIKKEG